MPSIEEYAEKMEIKKIVITMILGAFGFLLALHWRDVISETIDIFVPPGEGLLYKYMVAICLTIAIAIVTVLLLKIQKMNIVPDEWEPQKRVVRKIRKKKK